MRVLVCEDHIVFRRGPALVLEPEDDMEVVGEAADTAVAIAAVDDLEPDVVLMDLRMPGGGGLGATRAIKASHPDVKVVVLTVSDDDADLFEAVKAGAVGYLLKEVSIEEVGDAVRTAAAELAIAENTVKNHVRGVLEKLHVSSRTEATLDAVRHGFADED